MAETVVEERPTIPSRFYCHMCDEESNIPNTSTDYTCPICSGGFVEELPPATSSNSSVGGSSSTNNTGLMGSSNDEQQLEALRGQIANLWHHVMVLIWK
ncbi:hypothetical protein EVAR_101645_1 [Eumeta japonica]|uniref:RING-type E3 ubiquitin transferase n=1 Tax=Eumeta variegata TaxID=151549 RepID=A0A4C1TED3_EUMVA|nr:hypothetical protein EVAR_101645_1 [Eumeta japonica]